MFGKNCEDVLTWLQISATVGKPKVEMIHPVVIMPVSDVPALGSSYTSGEFFFEIEHLPAQQLYKMVEEKRTAAPSKDNPNVSKMCIKIGSQFVWKYSHNSVDIKMSLIFRETELSRSGHL